MKLRFLVWFVVIVAAVVILSELSSRLWGGKTEEMTSYTVEIGSDRQTAQDIIRENQLPPKPVLDALKVRPDDAGSKTLADLGITPEQARSKIAKSLALFQEHQSKNWVKIFSKFALWFLLLPIPFVLMFRKKISAKNRKILAAASVLIFGVALGSDPSPMGTVKDAVFLLINDHVVFPPRIIALIVFLAMVVIGNKFICSWGCQFGMLQEFLFRANRRPFDRKGIFRQIKLPFWLTNSIRVTVFVVFCFVAFSIGLDIIGLVDPFKIYNPAALAVPAIIFIAILLLAAPFMYRPWCHLACPFGLVSWLFEKLAIFRIKVNYHDCIACDLCERACPSTVMGAILRKDRVIPDCFSCGNCIDVCPTDAIRFSTSRRDEGDYAVGLKNKEIRRRERRSRSQAE